MENKQGSTVWSRQTIESDVFFWKPDKWFKIWFYIVNRVNYQDTKLFERGSAYIDYNEISQKTGATYDQVVKFIKWAKQEAMLKTEKSTRGNIITVLNYARYQDSIKTTKSKALGKAGAKQEQSTSYAIGETLKEIKEINKTHSVEVLEFFNKTCGVNLKLTDKKREQIKARLKTFSLDEIKQAIVARTKILWYAGKNADNKVWYKDWESLFRNDEKIDKMLNENTKSVVTQKIRNDRGQTFQMTADEIEKLRKADKIRYDENGKYFLT